MPKQSKPQSGKTIKRKQAGKPEPKSVLTHADVEAIRQAIRVDLDSLRTELRAEIDGLRTDLRAEIDGVRTDLRTELRDKTGALDSRVISLDGSLTELRTVTRERFAVIESQVSGLGTQIAELRTETRERFDVFASQFLRLDERVTSVEERLGGLEDHVRLLPTRDEFFSKTDELLTELRAIREEYLTLTHRVRGHEDRSRTLEEIHPGGQHA